MDLLLIAPFYCYSCSFSMNVFALVDVHFSVVYFQLQSFTLLLMEFPQAYFNLCKHDDIV